MTDQHPITPPPELVHQWASESLATQHLCTQAAHWGSDQELEACIEWMASQDWTWTKAQLFAARRPKPPSLKEQALALVSHDFSNQPCLSEEGYAIIRRALEALPND